MIHFIIWTLIGVWSVVSGGPEWHAMAFAGLGIGMWIAARLDEIRDLLQKGKTHQ